MQEECWHLHVLHKFRVAQPESLETHLLQCQIKGWICLLEQVYCQFKNRVEKQKVIIVYLALHVWVGTTSSSLSLQLALPISARFWQLRTVNRAPSCQVACFTSIAPFIQYT